MAPILEIKGLRKDFKDFSLKDISWDLSGQTEPAKRLL